jgi:hypothetical protein
MAPPVAYIVGAGLLKLGAKYGPKAYKAVKKWWKGDKDGPDPKKAKDDAKKTDKDDKKDCVGTCKKKPEKRDLKKYEQELKDKKYDEAEKKLDGELRDEAGWEKSATRDGNGVRYNDGKGGSVILNKGYPGGLKGGGGDAVHTGPYAKISNGGIISRVPLQ